MKINGNYNGVHKIMTLFHLKATICLAVTSCLFAGCMVGPTYHRPPTEDPCGIQGAHALPISKIRKAGKRRSPKTMRFAVNGGRSSTILS